MIQHLLQPFAETAGLTTYPGIDSALLARCESEFGFKLPAEHTELLRWSDGVEAFDGFFRLFGLRGLNGVDVGTWNNFDYWKFAWQERCLPYWCFGETAWGDQYAYAIDSLRKGTPSPVYFLEGMAMTPEIIASSFVEFFEKEFIRNARDPYDQMIRLVKQRIGTLDTTSHLVYLPPLLLGGTEDINQVEKMNARASMICNGDLALQLDNAPPNASVVRFETYEDAQHRTRLKLIWRTA